VFRPDCREKANNLKDLVAFARPLQFSGGLVGSYQTKQSYKDKNLYIKTRFFGRQKGRFAMTAKRPFWES